MIIGEIIVQSSSASVILHDKLPLGAAGLKVRFRFLDHAWENLSKTAVFRNRSQTLDVVIVDDCATIPQELLAKAADTVDVGVYGTDSQRSLAIPTVWGRLGTVSSAANPSGNSAAEPTLPYWAQLKEQLDSVLDTMASREDLEEVLRQAKESGEFDGPQGPAGPQGIQGIPGKDGADGYSPVKGVDYWTEAEQDQIVSLVADRTAQAISHSCDIIFERSGNYIADSDFTNREVAGLRLCGQTTQSATPTVQNPVTLDNAGKDGTVTVRITGRNLYDYTRSQVAKRVNISNGNIDDIANEQTASDFIRVKPNTAYTLNFSYLSGAAYGMAFYDSNKSFLSGIKQSAGESNSTTPFIFTTPANCAYLRFTTSPGALPIDQVMLHEGGTALPFEPYTCHSLTAATPAGLPGIPVSSGGNYTDETGQAWICDEMDIGRGVYIQRVNAHRITTPANAYLVNYRADTGYVQFTHKFTAAACSKHCLSPWLPYAAAGVDGGYSAGCYIYGTSTVSMSISKALLEGYGAVASDSATYKTAFIAWVNELAAAGTPLEFWYALATPIETSLQADYTDGFAALRTCKPYTSISNDADAGMTVGYVIDPKQYIDRKFDELAALLGTNS